jgi:hypothetical protein
MAAMVEIDEMPIEAVTARLTICSGSLALAGAIV